MASDTSLSDVGRDLEKAAEQRVGGEWRIYGYDSGWNDPRVLPEIAKIGYGQLLVLDEFHVSSSHVEDAIAWLEQNRKPVGTIYAEHEPSEIQKMRRAGIRVEKAKKSLDAGISEVCQRFKPGNDEGEDGRPGLLVSDRCQNLIRELLSYKEEHVGKSHVDDHCSDSLRYAVHSDAAGGGGGSGPRVFPDIGF